MVRTYHNAFLAHLEQAFQYGLCNCDHNSHYDMKHAACHANSCQHKYVHHVRVPSAIEYRYQNLFLQGRWHIVVFGYLVLLSFIGLIFVP